MALSKEEFLNLPKEEQVKLAGGGATSSTPISKEEFAALSPEEQRKLASGGESVSGMEEPLEAEPSRDRPVEAATQAMGNEILFGYGPQLAARVEQLTNKFFGPTSDTDKRLRELGYDIPDDTDYLKLRDENLRHFETLMAENPEAALGGKGMGSLASAAVVPGGAKLVPGLVVKGAAKAATVKEAAKRIAQTTLGAGAAGFIYNPGDVEGVVDPFQIEQRLYQGAAAATIGAAGQGVGEIVGGTFKAFSHIPGTLEKVSDIAAVKAAGGMFREFKQLYGKEKVGQIAKFLRDNGLVAMGDTTASIAKKTAILSDVVGKKIQQMYMDADNTLGMIARKPLIHPKLKFLYAKTEIQGRELAEGMALEISDMLKNDNNKAEIISSISPLLDDLAKRGKMTLSDVWDTRKSIDTKINFGEKLNDLPTVTQMRAYMRNKLQDVIQIRMNVADKIMGTDFGKQFKPLNTMYSNAGEVINMGKNQLARESARMTFGLVDVTAAAAGAATGGGLGALAGVITTKAMREYGSAATADLAMRAFKKLNSDPAALGRFSQKLFDGAVKGPRNFAILIENLAQDPEFKRKLK